MGHSHSSRAEETNTGEGTAAESIEVTEVGTAQVQADLHQSGATGAANTDGIQWFWGIKEDLLVRLPLVKSDWDLSDANLLKLFSATMFAYFSKSNSALSPLPHVQFDLTKSYPPRPHCHRRRYSCYQTRQPLFCPRLYSVIN